MVTCACDKIAARDLTERLTIQRKTRTADGQGGYSETWATIGTPYGMVRGLGGGERWQAMRVSPQNRFRAVIRFRGDANGAPCYSAADRVRWRGREYAVESVIDMESRRKWLELILVEGAPS